MLGLPYAQVEQTSSLVAGASANAQAAAQRLASRTVSGLGRLQVGSQHRTVFDDRTGFVVGYGLQWPLQGPPQPWAGLGTLQPDSPFPRLYTRLDYTRYLLVTRAKLELGAELGLQQSRTLTQIDGSSAEVTPGNDLSASLAWAQEFGPVDSLLGLRLLRQGMSRLYGQPQGDDVEELAAQVRVGFGNLRALEAGPLAWPYLVALTYDHGLHGRNTPVRRTFQLSVELYF